MRFSYSVTMEEILLHTFDSFILSLSVVISVSALYPKPEFSTKSKQWGNAGMLGEKVWKMFIFEVYHGVALRGCLLV